jgi:F0F1-type ATP synthase assembly protein I
MAFQLAAVLAVGVWAGTRIDLYFQTERPYFTAVLALLSLFAGLYLSLKDLIFGKKLPEEKEK